MSQESLKIEICESALESMLASKNSLTPSLRESAINQLNFLISYFRGENSDREKLFELTFGRFAAHEIAPREVELISKLNRAYYVASRTRDGLKLDLKVLGIDT